MVVKKALQFAPYYVFILCLLTACGGDDPAPVLVEDAGGDPDGGEIYPDVGDASGDVSDEDSDVGGDTGDPVEPAEIITTEGPIFLNEGQSLWVDAWVVDENGETLDDLSPTWELVTVSPAEGFTISADGHVQAQGPAPAEGVIQATYEELISSPVDVEVLDSSQCPEECTGGQVCDEDSGQCLCANDTHLCQGECVNSTSVDHCGDQCSPCQADNGYTPVCEAQQCDAICEAPKQVCGQNCTTCPDDPNATNVGCDGDQCVITECQPGFKVCDQGCCEDLVNELVEGDGSMIRGRVALVMDSTQMPHILFYDGTDSMLKYVSLQGNSWEVETVDFVMDDNITNYQEGDNLEDSSIHLAMVADETDTIHIAYRNDDEGLKYGRRDASGWDLEVVDDYVGGFTTSTSGSGSSLALDEDGNPHILYASEGAMISLASFDGSQWSIDEIGSGNRYPTVLAIDEQQRFHVLFFREVTFSERELVYAHRHLDDDPDWEESVFDNDERIASYDMAVQPDGTPSIIAVREGTGTDSIQLIEPSQDGWDMTTIVDDLDFSFQDSRVAFDSQGDLYVTYFGDDPDSNASGLIMTKQNGTQWEPELIDEMPEAMPYLDLFIDGDDNLFAAYRDPLFDSLVWAEQDGGQWTSEVAASEQPLVGENGSLVRDSSGTIHALYVDQSNDAIRHARRLAEDDWQIETVPLDAETFSDITELHISSDDSLHFAYSSGDSTHRINYLYYDGAQWNEEIISSELGGFGLKAFTLSNADTPYLLLQQSPMGGSSEYFLAHRDGGQWEFESVDMPTNTNHTEVLEIDSQGDVHIAYRNTSGIYYLTPDGDGWNEILVDDSAVFEQPIDLELHDDLPMIVYSRTSFSADEVYFASDDGSQWQIEVVSDDAIVEGRKDLRISESDVISISYYDEELDQLVLSTRSGGQWDSEELSSRAQPGGLIIDSLDRKHIGAFTFQTHGYFYLRR